MSLDLKAIALAAPNNLAERWDVALTYARSGCEHLGHALALGLCWERYRRRHPYTHDPLRYGAAVIEALLVEGASMAEVQEAGGRAYVLCLEGLVQVEGASDFSEPPGSPAGAKSGGGS